jgi:hypothetical protein
LWDVIWLTFLLPSCPGLFGTFSNNLKKIIQCWWIDSKCRGE